MTPRDVDTLRDRLKAAAAASLRISRHLDDLHGLAFLPRVGERERTSGGSWPPAGVEAVGDPRARDLWARLNTHARRIEMTLQSLEWAVGNLLAAGPSAEDTRGSLISRAEFADRIHNQARNQAAGEHIPVRWGDQPGYPGGGAAK